MSQSESDPKYFDLKICDRDVASKLLELNEAIAEVVFGFDRSGEPVHLDLDDEAIELISNRLNLSQDQFKDLLISTCTGISRRDRPSDVFQAFRSATTRWNNLKAVRDEAGTETPPALAMLALLAFAAEQMRRSTDIEGGDDRVRASNYYIRLCELVNKESWVTSEVGGEYRSVAKEIWGSLKDWLDAWQDERGICTVTFPSEGGGANWAVKMPISQALLRTTDRENLYQLFKSRGLDPGLAISDEMMALLLDEWCVSYGTSHLKNLWRNKDYRASLVTSAQSTLLIWPGSDENSGEEDSNRISSKVGLTIDVNSFTKRLDFGIEIRTTSNSIPHSVNIKTESGEGFITQVRAAGPRTVRVADYSAFDSESLIMGILRVTDSDSGLNGSRFPRTVVPLVASNFGRSYSEVRMMSLGIRHGLLVREKDDNGSLILERVEKVLSEVARPGWVRLTGEDLSGLPLGWALIENVEYLTFPESRTLGGHLAPLAPLEIEAMSLADGFRIPGRRERWLSDQSPNILAVFPYESDISLKIFDSSGNIVHDFGTHPRIAFGKTSDLHLKPGSYVIEAKSSEGNLLRKTLYLVDAATPNPTGADKSRSLASPISKVHTFGVISAEFATGIDQNVKSIRGLDLHEIENDLIAEDPDISERIPESRQWILKGDDRSVGISNRLRIEKAPARSCINEAHHWRLPVYFGGAKPEFITGECIHCKFTQQMTGRPKVRRELRASRGGSTGNISDGLKPLRREIVQSVPAMNAASIGLWDHALSALSYMRHGSVNDAMLIASQIASGSIAVDRLVRNLGALGHIDVKLDERCRPEFWSISPPVLVKTNENSGYISGYRSEKLIAKLEENVNSVNGDVEIMYLDNAPKIVRITLHDKSLFDEVVRGICDPVTGYEMRVQDDAASLLLRSIPSISEIASQSPKISIPAARQVNSWVAETASWKPTDHALGVGAFQNIGNGYVYTFNQVSIEPGDYTNSGTASLVKYVETIGTPNSLIFYAKEAKMLCTRLGAELPALIGRSLVALTGRLPIEDETDGLVKYHEVDEVMANKVFNLIRK